MERRAKSEDTRIVYGAGCVWWDSIDNVASIGGLPCCPHCDSVLFEVDSLKTFLDGAKTYEQEFSHPGYYDLILWMRGKCFKGMEEAKAAYENATKAKVTL